MCLVPQPLLIGWTTREVFQWFQVLISRQTLLSCTWACVCLKRHLVVVGCLASPVVVSFMALPLGVGRKAFHPPSPAASSTTAAASSEEEGLHARPLPHILEVAFFLVSGDFGGGRIGTFSLPPHIDEVFFGGGGTGPPRHILEDFSPFLKRDFELRGRYASRSTGYESYGLDRDWASQRTEKLSLRMAWRGWVCLPAQDTQHTRVSKRSA